MSRYRKIQVRMWGDERFTSLSPLPPSGQSLWIYLLTGPHTNAIPGLFTFTREGMAASLGWPLEAFDKALAEVFREGIAKASRKGHLMLIPKAIEHDKPVSPNVVRSWGDYWDELPECELKMEAYETLRAFIYGLGDAFAKAFDETIRKPSPKPSRMPSPNQEQEQEQEQEEHQSQKPVSLSVLKRITTQAAPRSKSAANAADVRMVFEHWATVMQTTRSALDTKRAGLIASALALGYSTADLCKAIDGCALSPFHMGVNEKSTKYNGLDLILRNADKIDGFIGMADRPPALGGGGGGQMTAQQRRDAESERNARAFLGLDRPNGAGDEPYTVDV